MKLIQNLYFTKFKDYMYFSKTILFGIHFTKQKNSSNTHISIKKNFVNELKRKSIKKTYLIYRNIFVNIF